jgi:hypothetical protein
MDLKDNDRIIEVRAAYALNRIYNYVNRKNFKEHLILLCKKMKMKIII